MSDTFLRRWLVLVATLAAPYTFAAGEVRGAVVSTRDLLPQLVQREIERALVWSDLFVNESGRSIRYGWTTGQARGSCPDYRSGKGRPVYQREPEELEYVASASERQHLSQREQEWARNARVAYPAFGKPYPPWADQYKIADPCIYRVERSRAAYLGLAHKAAKEASIHVEAALDLVDTALRRREPLCLTFDASSTIACVKPRTNPMDLAPMAHDLIAASTEMERLARVSRLAAFVAIAQTAVVVIEPQAGDYIVENPLVRAARSRIASDMLLISTGLERDASASRARAEAAEKKRQEIERQRAEAATRAIEGRRIGDR